MNKSEKDILKETRDDTIIGLGFSKKAFFFFILLFFHFPLIILIGIKKFVEWVKGGK